MNIWVTAFVLSNVINLCHLQFFHSFESPFKRSRLSIFYPLRHRSKSERGTTQPAFVNRRSSSFLPARRFDEKVKNLKYVDRKRRSADNSTFVFSGNVSNSFLNKKKPIKRIGVIRIKDDNNNDYNLPNKIDLNEQPLVFRDHEIDSPEDNDLLRLPRKAVKITGETRIKIKNNPVDINKEDDGLFDKVFPYSYDTKSSKEENFQANSEFETHGNQTLNGLKPNDILSNSKYLVDSLHDDARLGNYGGRTESKHKQTKTQNVFNNNHDIANDAQHLSSYSTLSQQPLTTAYTANPFMLSLGQSLLRLRPRHYNVSSLPDYNEYNYPKYDKESSEKGSTNTFRSSHLVNAFKPSFPDFSEYIPSLPLSMKPPSIIPIKQQQQTDHYKEFEEEILKSDLIKESAKRIKDGTWMKPKNSTFDHKTYQEENNSLRKHNIFLVSPPKQSKFSSSLDVKSLINSKFRHEKEKKLDSNKHMWPESTTQYPVTSIKTRRPSGRNKYQEIPLPERERPFDIEPLIRDSDSKEKNNQLQIFYDDGHNKYEQNFRNKEESYENDRNRGRKMPFKQNKFRVLQDNSPPVLKDTLNSLKNINYEETDFNKPRYYSRDNIGSLQNKDPNFNNSFIGKNLNTYKNFRYHNLVDQLEKDSNFDNTNYKKSNKNYEPSVQSYKVYRDSFVHDLDGSDEDFSMTDDYQKRKFYKKNHRSRHPRIMDIKSDLTPKERYRNEYYYPTNDDDDYEDPEYLYRYHKPRDNDDNYSRSVYRYNRKRPKHHRKIYDDNYNMRIRPDYRPLDDDYKHNSLIDYNSIENYDPYFAEMKDYNDYLYRKTKDYQNHHYFQKMKEYYDDHGLIDDQFPFTVNENLPSNDQRNFILSDHPSLNPHEKKSEFFHSGREINFFQLSPPPPIELSSTPLVPPPLVLKKNESDTPQPDFPFTQSSYVKAFSDENIEEKQWRYQNLSPSKRKPKNHNRNVREDNLSFDEYGYNIDDHFDDFPKFGFF